MFLRRLPLVVSPRGLRLHSSSTHVHITIPHSALEQPLTTPLPGLPLPGHVGGIPPSSSSSSSAHVGDNHAGLPSAGLNEGAKASAHVDGEKVKMSVLPNGMRVCTLKGQGHNSAVGVLVETGARFEGPLWTGATQLLKLLAFQSTSSRSPQKMIDDISAIGGNLACVHTRENIIYSGGVFSYHVPQTLEILADTIRRPLITNEEFEEQQRTAVYELENLYEKPEMLLPEIVHSVAYKNNCMSYPVLAEIQQLDTLSAKAIKEFHQKFYQPNRMIISGTGVDHQEFLDQVYQLFGDMKNDPKSSIAKIPARYTGGDLFKVENKKASAEIPSDFDRTRHDPTDFAHLFVAFEGVPYDHPDLYALATLQLMMGGGGSFSSGGPGKGMYSRLYSNVLNQHAWIHTAVTFNNCYSDTGLFGFYFSAESKYARNLYGVIAEELMKMTLRVGETELSRARNQLKSSLLMNLESRAIQLEDILRQVHILGKHVSAEELCYNIDKVSEADIRRVARTLLLSNPSVVTYGKVEGLPQNASQIFGEFFKKSLKG